MRKMLSVFTVLLLVFCCGCGSYREIERGYFVTAFGIEKQGRNFNVTFETLSSSDNQPGSESIKILYGEGASLDDAYGSIKKSLVKALYFEHCGVIALGGNFTSDEIQKILDFCNNIETLNTDVYVVRTDNTAELLQTQAAYKSVGYSIIELIKNSDRYKKPSNQLYNIRKEYTHGSKSELPLVNVKNDTLILE